MTVLLGQKLNQKQVDALANLDENATWQETLIVKYRKQIGILIPFLFRNALDSVVSKSFQRNFCGSIRSTP